MLIHRREIVASLRSHPEMTVKDLIYIFSPRLKNAAEMIHFKHQLQIVATLTLVGEKKIVTMRGRLDLKKKLDEETARIEGLELAMAQGRLELVNRAVSETPSMPPPCEQVNKKPRTRTLEDILYEGSLRETNFAGNITKRSCVIRMIIEALGKQRTDFDEETLESAHLIDPIEKDTECMKIESRLTKVARRMLYDNDENYEIMIAFRNSDDYKLKIIKVNSDTVKEVDINDVSISPETCMCICDLKYRLLSYSVGINSSRALPA
jgi:hypothetical protein